MRTYDIDLYLLIFKTKLMEQVKIDIWLLEKIYLEWQLEPPRKPYVVP